MPVFMMEVMEVMEVVEVVEVVEATSVIVSVKLHVQIGHRELVHLEGTLLVL